MSFEWPWQYDFPPFFTMQINKDTKAKQMEAWCSLILLYFRHHKIFKLRLSDADSLPLFNNKAINRNLSTEAVSEILEFLYKKGNVEWSDKSKTSCLLFWKTPAQLSELIYNWAVQTGNANSVCTMHELTRGADTETEEFHGLDNELLIRVLKLLEVEGKAELIGNEGVKFFA